MKIRWQTASLALFLALSTWFLVTGREKVETWISVPVEMIGAQKGIIIQDGFVNHIEVRVRGPRELVRSLKDEKLGYPLNVSELKIGKNPLELDTSLLDISSAYEVMEFKPARLLLTVDRISSKNVPVYLVWEGEKEMHRDYQLKEVKITPAFVELVGPQSLLDEVVQAEVTLDAIFAEEVPEEWNTELPVILAPEIESRPGRVRVDLKLGPKTQRIPVKVRDFALDLPKDINLSIKTKLVTLEIEGPVFLFRDDDFRKKISIQVQVKEKLEPGKRQVPFTVSLPENCTLFSSSPETLTAIVKEK